MPKNGLHTQRRHACAFHTNTNNNNNNNNRIGSTTHSRTHTHRAYILDVHVSQQSFTVVTIATMLCSWVRKWRRFFFFEIQRKEQREETKKTYIQTYYSSHSQQFCFYPFYCFSHLARTFLILVSQHSIQTFPKVKKKHTQHSIPLRSIFRWMRCSLPSSLSLTLTHNSHRIAMAVRWMNECVHVWARVWIRLSVYVWFHSSQRKCFLMHKYSEIRVCWTGVCMCECVPTRVNETNGYIKRRHLWNLFERNAREWVNRTFATVWVCVHVWREATKKKKRKNKGFGTKICLQSFRNRGLCISISPVQFSIFLIPTFTNQKKKNY